MSKSISLMHKDHNKSSDTCCVHNVIINYFRKQSDVTIMSDSIFTKIEWHDICKYLSSLTVCALSYHMS